MMKKCLLLCLTMFALVKIIRCERLHGPEEVVRLRQARERSPGRVRIRSSSRIYLPPATNPEPGEGSFQKEVYLFKTLKQLLNQTRKILEPRENWSRADDENVDYKNDDENHTKRMENSANFQNSNKKRKNKKCKCECEKDLIIKIPAYRYRDIPLGKEVSSNHINGNLYESSAADGRSTFESMDNDHEPKESTWIDRVKLNHRPGHRNSFGKRDDFRKLLKERLPEKNLNYVKKRYNPNRKRSNVKKSAQNKTIKRKLDDSSAEYADTTNEEPIDFIYNGDYLDRSNESHEIKREDYHQYIDLDSQDVDVVEDYDSVENLTENKSAENYYDAEQV